MCIEHTPKTNLGHEVKINSTVPWNSKVLSWKIVWNGYIKYEENILKLSIFFYDKTFKNLTMFTTVCYDS